MTNLYEDAKITCDDEGLTIRSYHFPIPTKKRMRYADIKELQFYTLTTYTGKYKFWGGNHRYWLNLDWGRAAKNIGIVLIPKGWWRPIITPDDPAEVLRILEEKTGLTATPEKESDQRPTSADRVGPGG